MYSVVFVVFVKHFWFVRQVHKSFVGTSSFYWLFRVGGLNRSRSFLTLKLFSTLRSRLELSQMLASLSPPDTSHDTFKNSRIYHHMDSFFLPSARIVLHLSSKIFFPSIPVPLEVTPNDQLEFAFLLYLTNNIRRRSICLHP